MGLGDGGGWLLVLSGFSFLSWHSPQQLSALAVFLLLFLFFLDKHMLVPSLVLGWVDLEHQFVFGPCTILSVLLALL